MGDDKKQDSTSEVDDKETNGAESGDNKKAGSAGAPAPADDVIIIK